MGVSGDCFNFACLDVFKHAFDITNPNTFGLFHFGHYDNCNAQIEKVL